VRRSDQQRSDKTAGGWLPLRLLKLDRFSENGVGRTGFEPVTSSVSENSRAVPCVCHRRTESNREPLNWANILATSRWVWRRLKTLAPISGSHRLVPGLGSAPDGVVLSLVPVIIRP